jgi:hypothetical protein
MLKKRDLERILATASPDADIVLEPNYLYAEFVALQKAHGTPNDSSVVIYVRDHKTIVIATTYSWVWL